MTYEQHNRIVEIAMNTGKFMLLYGAETYRVEETVERMAVSKGLNEVNVFVIPTGIIFSATYEGQTHTRLKRVAPSGIDLEYIDAANAFSRQFTANNMSLEEAEKRIEAFADMPKFKPWMTYIFGGMAGGFFVPLFGGNFVDFLLSYILCIVTLFTWNLLSKRKLNFFIKNLLGSFVSSLLGFFFVLFAKDIGLSTSFNMVLIGPLMTMVPGVSLTNGIRDLISGELLAGSAKIMEALFVAIALAFGVGIVLQLMKNFI